MITHKYAQVLIPSMGSALTYSIPERLRHINIGYEVCVEIRNRIERGWVCSLHSTAPEPPPSKKDIADQKSQQSLFTEKIESKIKVKEILDGHEAFLEKDLEFFKIVSEYYCSNLSEVLENAVPRKVDERLLFGVQINFPHDKFEDILNSLPKRATAQKAALELIIENQGLIPGENYHQLKPNLKRAFDILVKEGHVVRVTSNNKDTTAHESIPKPELTTEQAQALAKIEAGISTKKYSPFLLFGITGSGKTEVYLRAIEAAIANGGSALLIVPEIALTPQLFSRFDSRLPHSIAVLHSQIGSGTKWSEWTKILNGERRIIIGARSAIFAPIKDLKIIIVDEEHESSYKQAEGLRYNARDLALIRGKNRNCPVILGSATPSFESILNAQKQSLQIIELTERATKAKLPEINVLDLKSIPRSGFASPNITNRLFEEITVALGKKEQVIIFYNKRGFASFLQCATCGKSVECPHCSVTLTYYQRKNKLSCHYCGLSRDCPEACLHCTNTETHEVEESTKKKKIGKLVPRGSGTEKVFEEIQELFPDAKIDRMDRESVGQKGSIENILAKMNTGETQILIGTQMLAKGHDLPSVTLVGIIDADVGLHFPDFRSSERTFQLIVQASGRAGRGTLPGKVIIQTREPNHPTIVAASTSRFKAFARYELEFRKKLGYPPDGRLARIIISSPDKRETSEASFNLVKFLNNLQSHEEEEGKQNTPWRILGPSPCPIEKLRGRNRWHVLIKSKSSRKLSELAREIKTWKSKIKQSIDLRVIIDIDPVDMM